MIDVTNGPFTQFPKTTPIWCFPIGQEILNVSQIGVKFHGICLPIFIQTLLKQCYTTAFFHSAHCSLSNPISLRTVWCRRTMIPGEIFTSFPEFQGIVSVNDFRFPLGLQELLQTHLRLCCFCFARIQHDHWVTMSCTMTAHRWLFRDSKLYHQNFLHEVRLHQWVFCTGIL